MFPDAEGWENVDPDEAAKWGVGSEFPPYTPEQSQTEGGAAAEIPTGIVYTRSRGYTLSMWH